MEADWPMIAVRFALYAVLGSLFGLSSFGLYGLRTGERGDALPLKPWLAVLAVLVIAGLVVAIRALNLA